MALVARRAAIYTRISLDAEGEGLGVARQEADCRRRAAELGWDVVAVHQDNSVSAFTGKTRPGYEALVDDLKNGVADALVVWKPDRLHRRPVELEEFIDLVELHDIAVATVAGGGLDLTTSEGRAMARVVGAFARMESEVKAERQRRKHLQLAETGQPVGGTRPFGYEKGGLVVRESEAQLIREAAARLLAGGTLRGICLDWNTQGIEAPRGGRWTQNSIKRILTSWRTGGIRALAGEPIAPAAWPAILDETTHRQLRDLLLASGRGNGGFRPRTHVLTGLLRCWRCGTSLNARRGKNRRRTYICANDPQKGGCGGLRIVADYLEQHVAAAVSVALDAPALEQARAQLADGPDVAAGELAAAEAKLRGLADDWAADRITKGEWLTARATVEARIIAAHAELARRQQASVLASWAGDGAALLERWDQLPIDRQRGVLDAVIDHITIGPGHPGAIRFDPARVTITWKV